MALRFIRKIAVREFFFEIDDPGSVEILGICLSFLLIGVY